ncbi:type II toxin-antitoxin system HicA family toxin [Mannheimia haemolytica]|uniref:type II toxin-antitoxin system HicA family toxin n=1 Tax=Mannheimia haemolytica TaxID=75985 RepID=UPI002EBC2525|nr:type II toxin-antitoxin system HicA family toxin [Mannheimia haemolytica]
MVVKILKRKSQKTLQQIYTQPISANIKWTNIEALFLELGAEIEEREGSRIAVVLFQPEYFIAHTLILIQIRGQ